MRLRTTRKESSQGQRAEIAKEILNDRYINFSVENEFRINENLKAGHTSIYCTVALTGSQKSSTLCVEGSGHGPVDAFFSSLVNQLSEEFSSLKSLEFEEFGINADFSTLIEVDRSGSSAQVEAVLGIRNGRGDSLIFRDKSHSVNGAAIGAVLRAVEHFVNSEMAAMSLKKGIASAKTRNRGDVEQQCIGQLSELVKNTCYEQTFKNKKR